MTDRPILFSAPMVRALLDGSKTQTRRVLKNMPPAPDHDNLVHPPKHDAPYFDAYCGGKRTAANPRGMSDDWCWWTRDDRAGQACKVPFVPGDRLWVKETWRAPKSCDGQKPSEILAGSRVWHEADRDNCDQHGKIRVAIFMPRWASRITLLVTDVRVERLQDCSEGDAIAEGVKPIPFSNGPNFYSVDIGHGSLNAPTAAETYALLWHSINGDGAWDANPWVVAVTFEVVRGNIDQVATS